ncbi:hypothetical protein [Geomicrobium sediminis]|uniref:Uncharacterized protein n=1 Tax=Geomicrobium sediminis TaxID=1347788 RepID=A0ABS2PEI1_9BACL|nr:hypothetical protein [Geomicrobium sediminis]MBM7633818.1 hypothetical protein [Geomicrobium sediminis]
MQDIQLHGIGAGANLRGRRKINFYVQDTEPTARNVGDVWIEYDTPLDVRLSESELSTKDEGIVWQQIDNLEYLFDLEHVNAFFDGDNEELIVRVAEDEIKASLNSKGTLLWENGMMHAFGELGSVFLWNEEESLWFNLQAHAWNGDGWQTISRVQVTLYDNGEQVYQFVGNHGRVYFNNDNIEMWITDSASPGARFVSEELIDVTGYSKLEVHYRHNRQSGNSTSFQFGISSNNNTTAFDAQFSTLVPSTAMVVDEVDISNFYGDYYIKAYGRSQLSSNARIYVHKIILKR